MKNVCLRFIKDQNRPCQMISCLIVLVLYENVYLGNIYWASLCAVAYFYMVSSWGGYVFLINMIPLHVLGNKQQNIWVYQSPENI